MQNHGRVLPLAGLLLLAATTSLAAGLYPNPQRAPRWRLAWSDEFEGPPCDPARPRACSAADWHRTLESYGTPDAPVATVVPFAFHVDPADNTQWTTRHYSHLGALDKCTWLVSDHASAIHFQGPAGPISRFRPEAVQVSRGEMRITARRARPGPVDCGRRIREDGPNNEASLSKDCPYEAGNVISFATNGLDAAGVNGAPAGRHGGDGRVFREGGRLEVRARLPRERGNMAALWTWQQDWRTPEREYDLLENWVNWPQASLHSIQGPGTSARHLFRGEHSLTLSNEFHVYSMEWQRDDHLAYFLDNRHLATWRDSTRPDGDRIESGNQCVENRIGGNPFYLILWNLMLEYDWAPESRPWGAGQAPDTLYVDYVRYFERCDDPSDPACVESTLSASCPNPCGGFGAFDGYNCLVGAPPAGQTALIAGGEFAYRARFDLLKGWRCLHGGERLGSTCRLGGPPPGRIPFVYANAFYTRPTCSTTTRPNCSDPCPWEGTTYDPGRHACRVGRSPAGAPPAGARPWIEDDVVYYDVERCPYGGQYDGAGACRLVELPEGARAFVYEGGLYYEPVSTVASQECPYGGAFDSRNCLLGSAPDGSEPYAVGHRIDTPAQCGETTDWQAVPPGEVTVQNVCR